MILNPDPKYFTIAVFFSIALVLSCIMVILPYILARFKDNKAKLTTYECGFDPLGSNRNQFDVRFYLVSMLFILFDLEIAFLIPWSLTLKKLGSFGFYSMIIFLIVLIIGFIYEWLQGALS